MEHRNQNADVIDLREIIKKILSKKKLYVYVLGITFVLASALILCVPRYYKSTVSLVPEMGGATDGGALGSIVASFGIDMGDMQGGDAISPLLYPDLMQSNDFVVGLLDIPIQTADGSVQTTYYDYMWHHYKRPFWKIFQQKIKNRVKALFQKKEDESVNNNSINVFRLTKLQTGLFARIKDAVQCKVDNKTGVITIMIQDQDPLVAATIADSAQSHLQDYIIRYRTSKARVDVEHYEELTRTSRQEYEDALAAYSIYCDRHKDAVLQTYLSTRDKLENDMQIKYSTYSALMAQLETAKAKLQERIPAFTMLESPTVPIKPAGPKRVFFVLGMMFFVGLILSLYVVKDELLGNIK